MPAEIHCPKCPSVSVLFGKKRGVNVCEDCGYEFAADTYCVRPSRRTRWS